jgi:molybdopterin synthase sulfur carrier subunit
VRAVYFAWVRERIGKTDEMLDPPADVRTISDLIAWLSAQNENYAYAFENPNIIRAAINQNHVAHDTSIAGAHEIAFFPPMTGG